MFKKVNNSAFLENMPDKTKEDFVKKAQDAYAYAVGITEYEIQYPSITNPLLQDAEMNAIAMEGHDMLCREMMDEPWEDAEVEDMIPSFYRLLRHLEKTEDELFPEEAMIAKIAGGNAALYAELLTDWRGVLGTEPSADDIMDGYTIIRTFLLEPRILEVWQALKQTNSDIHVVASKYILHFFYDMKELEDAEEDDDEYADEDEYAYGYEDFTTVRH